jgi:hypothetical protein
MNPYHYTTYARRPDLVAAARSVNGSVWTEFMFHDAVANRLWDRLEGTFADYQTLQGNGLSCMVLRGMRHRAAQAGLAVLIAPARPTLKSQYPLTSMERRSIRGCALTGGRAHSTRLRSMSKPIGVVTSSRMYGCSKPSLRLMLFCKETNHVSRNHS